MSNYGRTSVYFHTDETNATANGIELSVGGNYDTLVLEATSTGTCKLIFEGASQLGEWRPLLGAKMNSNLDLMTETTDLAPFYQIGLDGMSKVRIRLDSNTGTTSVAGRVVG